MPKQRITKEMVVDAAFDIARSGGMGQAYIQLAKDEPHLFKIFILRQRDGISSFDDLYQLEAGSDMAGHMRAGLTGIRKQRKCFKRAGAKHGFCLWRGRLQMTRTKLYSNFSARIFLLTK